VHIYHEGILRALSGALCVEKHLSSVSRKNKANTQHKMPRCYHAEVRTVTNVSRRPDE